jgi:hypothetical protein
MGAPILKCDGECNLHQQLDSSIDQPFVSGHGMEGEFLQSESSKIRVLNEASSFRIEVVLSKMRKCSMFEAESNATTLDRLLSHANGHSRDVDEKTPGTSDHHLLDPVVIFESVNVDQNHFGQQQYPRCRC